MNIVRQPNEDKFRQFKKSNQAIKSRVLVIKETLDIIKEIGYVELDSDLLAFQNSDITNINTAIKVLQEYVDITKIKLDNIEAQKSLENNEEARKLNEEINKKYKEEQLRKLAIQKQMQLDKDENKDRKAQDSVGTKVEYGAKMCKFEPKNEPRGG